MSLAASRPSSETKPSTIKKLAEDFTTLMPCCCTTCGSSGVASCSLFCTCTWAMSASAQLVKVSEICTWPVEVLDDDMYCR
ncbi:hypothetical protein ABIF60_004444 [Bradyrhizobium japonicum]